MGSSLGGRGYWRAVALRPLEHLTPEVLNAGSLMRILVDDPGAREVARPPMIPTVTQPAM